ncbi:hypothetical protein CDL12_09243 [Handroanthus impetiginosus]|uniref:Uncharacterized protein n=1 Tax=Handroanthus impetiginosus TaxID=429701 RepID=A0A2G9HKM5_9LAMI|nr:hypothetical protein CDL12_09243 [Handroanthus impetiginosus]
MWKENALRFGNNAQKNEDSDQSISEEEEGLEDEWTGNTVSLGGVEKNEGRIKVVSQLETLRDSYELQSTAEESISSHERKEVHHIDDEVEDPLFNDGGGSSCFPRVASATCAHSNEGLIRLPTKASISDSDEEIISDDEKINLPILRSMTRNVGGTWSEASREAEALVWLKENSSCSSSHGVIVKENKSSKGAGGRTKAKPKFLFRFHSHEIGAAADKDMDKFMADSQLILHEKEFEQPENHTVPSELAHEQDFKGHSMADFLDCFQERNDLLQGTSKLDIKSRGRKLQTVLKRNTLPLGDRNLGDDDLSGSTCSDDEENAANLRPIASRRTMADQFHEAFGTVTGIDETPSCGGLYGKLQRVMRIEKERDVDYIKNISTLTAFKDESTCLSVRILSRSLEAKLIICSCTSIEDGKNSHWESNLHMKIEGVTRTLTIIFNPRVCSDVEIEVGNLICIRPPWKEVQVKGKDEVILLCSYFSQVPS